MKQLKELSFKDKNAIFGRLEELVSQANLSQEECAQYEYEWKIYNDYFNTIESAEKKGKEEGFEEGFEEGLEEGRTEGRAEGLAEGRAEGRAEGEQRTRLENAGKMKNKGYPLADIADITGLSVEEIEGL